MTFTDAKQRFSSRVADYLRYRPHYPPALLELLRKECGLRPQQVIADIGSGTGLLSELFLKQGHPVFGVEPNPEMRQAGEEYLQSYPGFTSVDGSAEATTLASASVDFVSAGQAFHWFDKKKARAEFQRILRGPGWIVAAWNFRDRESPFGEAYEHLLVKYGTDYAKVRDSYPESHDLDSFFAGSEVLARTLPNGRRLNCEQLAGLLRSASYMPEEGQANFLPMMNALGELYDRHQVNGGVEMNFTTHIYFGQLPASVSHP